jgi:hypothetical protein
MAFSARYFLMATLLCGAATVPCAADDAHPTQATTPPATLDGMVKLSGGVMAAGVGYKWGHGTLFYQGQEYKFCIRGLSIGDVGAVHVDAQGAVYNLKSLDDFAGKYFALSGGFAIARGESGAILKNKQGVMMELEMLETGVRFNIAASGLKVTMANVPGCKAH